MNATRERLASSSVGDVLRAISTVLASVAGAECVSALLFGYAAVCTSLQTCTIGHRE